ncbi:neutral zinc metallopeptidase [Streptomyces erythrochromogenes]|uniref:neutral zinc metallopeptidase n=1 Tax=Streptomyces erythrochromogenes TaxID=285574 RepID=UPI0036A0AC1C
MIATETAVMAIVLLLGTAAEPATISTTPLGVTQSVGQQKDPSPDPEVEESTGRLPKGEEASPGEHLGANLAGSDTAGYTMHDFLEYSVKDIDAFWSNVWEAAGYTQPEVEYYFPTPGEVTDTSCGPSDDETAAYCPADDLITFSQAMAVKIWEGAAKTNTDANSTYPAGDFSVAYAIAHEYAHSLQDDLGIIQATSGQTRRFPIYKTELHADCWAGIWANSTFHKGTLEPGDIEEAVRTTMDLGSYDSSDDQFHGTPAQRRDAFLTGWNSGVASQCDRYLLVDH